MLISDAYRALNTQLHEDKPTFGASGHKWAGHVHLLIRSHQTPHVLDYGCGKQTLRKAIKGVKVRGYDPAIEGLDKEPEPADIVVCTDVLEHIEPELLDNVLAHIKSLTRNVAFLVVSTRAAKKKLPDGRNAHLIVENPEWWQDKLKDYFDFWSWNVEDDNTCFYAVPRREK